MEDSKKKEEFEIKESTGFLYQNDKKNDRQPDVRGEIKINGKLYNVAGWEKVTKNGTIFHSLTIQDKEAFLKSRSDPNLSTYIEEKKDVKNTKSTDNKKENVFLARKREKENKKINKESEEKNKESEKEETIVDELMKMWANED